MAYVWNEGMYCCDTHCPRCEKELKPDEKRILSVYDHKAICLVCKAHEEQKPDYSDISKELIGTCMAEVELRYSDPGAYCFYHFYPFTC